MILLENINKFKNKNALTTENNEIITYKTLVNFSEKISAKIKNRCLVFLLCGNNIETISGYLAFLKSDCVISLLYYLLNYLIALGDFIIQRLPEQPINYNHIN